MYLRGMGQTDYEFYQLSNGLRIAHKRITGTRLVHCGFIIHAGSSNDGANPGIAHCMEHMVFKGTQKRKTIHVLNHLEVVGGEMNAFTTKEFTAIYASVQAAHFMRAVDILADVTFSSAIPDVELEKEKKVITEEINMYLDTPEENIYDEFHEQIYGKHPLAHNILGSAESLKKLKRQDLLEFIHQWYALPNMVFSVVGNVSLKRVVAALEKYVLPLQVQGQMPEKKLAKVNYSPLSVTRETDHQQAYAIFGGMAYPEGHANKWKLLLLNNLLGGPGLNSRLNLAIREKYGYTYHVESGYQTYMNSGLFHVYLSSEKKYIEKSVNLALQELKKLKTQKLGLLQLSRAKNQFAGQMVMSDESRTGLMVHNGRGILTEGRAISLKEVIAEIQKISATDLMETAVDIFDESNFSYLTYLPE